MVKILIWSGPLITKRVLYSYGYDHMRMVQILIWSGTFINRTDWTFRDLSDYFKR